MKLPKVRFPNAAALAIAAGVSLATVPAKAANIIYSCPGGQTQGYCTLEQLFAGGFIEVDENLDGIADKIFDTWGQPVPNTSINYSDIQVSAFVDPYTVGLQYDVKNNALLLNPTGEPGQKLPQSMSVNYSFNLKSINLWKPTKNTLELTDATTTTTTVPGGIQPTSSAQIEEIVYPNGKLLPPQGSKLVSQDNTGNNQLIDQLTLTESSDIFLNNTIQLNAFSPATNKRGLSKITQFRQTFSATQVPEPGTIMGLLVFGGLGLAMKRQEKDC